MKRLSIKKKQISVSPQRAELCTARNGWPPLKLPGGRLAILLGLGIFGVQFWDLTNE